MKTNVVRNIKSQRNTMRIARFSLLVALISSMPISLLAGEREQRGERAESFPRFSQEEQTTRLQNRSELTPERTAISKDYIRRRLDWLKVKDPIHAKTHAYFDKLIEAGYDPLVLDAWLDGLYDGVIVIGMPGDLVESYYGDPLFINNIVYDGAPAVEWGIPLLPGRVEKITIVGDKVVRVRG